jgi:hypothetical protein
MSEKNETKSGMYIIGTCNGVNSRQDKNGKWWHSLIVVIPNSENNIRVGLDTSVNPQEFTAGQQIHMSILPFFFQGKFSGYRQVV